MGWLLGLLGLGVTGTLLPLMLRRLQPAARPVRVWTATAVFTAFSFHLVALSFVPSMLSLMVRTRLVGSEPSAFTALAFQWIQQVVVLPVMLGVSGIGMLVSAAFCLQLPSLFLLGDARALGVGTAPFLRGAWQGLLLLVVLLPGWYPFTGLCEWILELTGRELAEQATVMLLRLHLELGNHGTLALLGLTAVVCAPLAEELVFRGLLYSWLAGVVGRTPAVILSGLMFGVAHLNVVALVPLSVLGMLLAIVHERTGSLWPCIVLHALFNGTQVMLVLTGVQ